MDRARDPFRTLALPYDAGSEDVRQAFRRLARETHPDRGGAARAFHEVRTAYAALTADLEAERQRWAPSPPSARFAGGLDPRAYPTCPVRVDAARGGRRVRYDVDARPATWRPPQAPPPGGRCVERVEGTGTTPAFGVWVVSLDPRRYRCVFGPPPSAA